MKTASLDIEATPHNTAANTIAQLMRYMMNGSPAGSVTVIHIKGVRQASEAVKY